MCRARRPPVLGAAPCRRDGGVDGDRAALRRRAVRAAAGVRADRGSAARHRIGSRDGLRDDTGQAHGTWAEVFRAALDEVLAELTWLDGDERRLADSTAARIEHEAPALLSTVHQPRLVHRDLHPGNFLVEGKATVLLDFEMVREWDAAYDFIKINSSLLDGAPEEAAAFHAGYAEHVATDDAFAARVRLYQGLYGLLSAAGFHSGNGRHRHWASRLRRWLAAEQDGL
ncbi:phosphotransferase [Microlunatus sp. GCM10028923]|uniref:phosphotransferase n=1 Tax=Microlunatus sp. GCM10028923 TaxID=3273400 RepID=UPI003619F257